MNEVKTLKEAKLLLKKLNISITKKDGEYRVNYFSHCGGLLRMEATAYYTTDLQDAVDTAKREFCRRH
jgi:hypothetical protein